jgi:hypothetical protein
MLCRAVRLQVPDLMSRESLQTFWVALQRNLLRYSSGKELLRKHCLWGHGSPGVRLMADNRKVIIYSSPRMYNLSLKKEGEYRPTRMNWRR